MKSSQSTRIRILNPFPGGSAFTSLRAAEDSRDRGRAVLDKKKGTLRYLDEAEVVMERQAYKDQRRDAEYWEAVAGQMGGTAKDLEFVIKKSSERPTMAGGPEGYGHMALIPMIRCSAQPKH